MTNVTEAQKAQVGTWLSEGLQISEIQSRLARELGLSLTYMELKLLVSELNVMPKDKEPTAPVAHLAQPSAKAPTPAMGPLPPVPPGPIPIPTPPPPGPKGKVAVMVDTLARPGAMVSGGVTFSDGKRAAWYVDEMGRLSVAASEPGYRPPAGDMQEFQAALERELARAGF